MHTLRIFTTDIDAVAQSTSEILATISFMLKILPYYGASLSAGRCRRLLGAARCHGMHQRAILSCKFTATASFAQGAGLRQTKRFDNDFAARYRKPRA